VDFRYALARDVAPTVQVYDVQGRVVRSLDASVQTEGLHSTYWDRTDRHGTRVSPGVYWIRLSTDRVSDTRKVVLVE
jgi:flagellar hook assembly protein FlgD